MKLNQWLHSKRKSNYRIIERSKSIDGQSMLKCAQAVNNITQLYLPPHINQHGWSIHALRNALLDGKEDLKVIDHSNDINFEQATSERSIDY